MGFQAVSSGKQKIPVSIAIRKSLVDLDPINFRNLFALIFYCNNKPEAEIFPTATSAGAGGRRSAIASAAFWSSLFLDKRLTPTWSFLPRARRAGLPSGIPPAARLLAPGLLAFGRLAAIHPRRSSQGSCAACRRER